MPQISKIRITNFQYNDGNRLIADELYNFENENKGPTNTLFRLANGGGKSVLVQLMMQPIIPKAKVAERRIESFFKKATDHCYVVLEWTLDNNSRTKLMTGIAMAASDSSTDADADRGFQIKYYTFISSYQNYKGNYNIITLPLSSKNNGKFVPAAFDEVRNLAKRSNGGLERYSSDDSVKWQERLSQYGIIQSEWRMIEELNSSEDGVSKYFDNLKVSDAVIDKLIIPRIEEKQKCAVSKEDSSLESMLISYAKNYSKKQEVINERENLAGFHEMLALTKTEAEELWNCNDSLEKCIEKLFAYTDALATEISSHEKKEKELKTKLKEFKETINHIKWEKASEKYYTTKEAHEQESALLKAAEETRTAAEEKLEKAKKKLLLMESAYYYSQLKSLENDIAIITEEIQRRENNTESAERLASLKYSAYLAIQAELDNITSEITGLKNNRDNMKTLIVSLCKDITLLENEVDVSKTARTKNETILEKQKKDNDETVEELKIGAYRMFDGKYSDAELNSWKTDTGEKGESISKDIEKTKAELKSLEERKDAIPQKLTDTKNEEEKLAKELSTMEDLLAEYKASKEKTLAVFNRYSLDTSFCFTNHGTNYLKEQLTKNELLIKAEERRIEATNEAIAAVERGTLHIPKLLSDYLDSTGIRYTSVEQYILKQQSDGTVDALKILERYPFAAYGIIVDQTDKKTVCEETNGYWLPAVLPVFTHDDIQAMLNGEEIFFASVSAYSSEYFQDKSSYAANLQKTLDEQNSHKQQLEERKKTLETDAEIIEVFLKKYDKGWEARTLSEKEKLKADIEEKQKHIQILNAELNKIKEDICKTKENVRKLEEESRQNFDKLVIFEKLLKKLEEEDSLTKKLEDIERNLSNLECQLNQKRSEQATKEAELNTILDKLKELNERNKLLCNGFKKVSDAVESEISDGDWEKLLSQYEMLLSEQSADLKRLNDDENRLLEEVEEKKKEIRKRECNPEEYEILTYSEELETEAAIEEKKATSAYKEANDICSEKSRSQAKAETLYETATKELIEFGSKPLPSNKVSSSFNERISEIEKKIAEIDVQSKTNSIALNSLLKIQGKVESVIEQYQRPGKTVEITLETDYVAQLNGITGQIQKWSNSVKTSEQNVIKYLEEMASKYGTESADVRSAISSMQELLLNKAVRGDRYFTLCDHIDANMHTASLRISQINTDLKEFNEAKGDLIRQCVTQGKQMYEGLKQISGNSKVEIQKTRRPILMFDIPKAVDENIATAAIAAEIDKGTEEIVAMMTDDSYAESELRRIAIKTVGSKRLLRKYVGTENIELRALKIDRTPGNSGYRTWEQTKSLNSGAEKFVVYLTLILALMAYTRDGYDDKKNRSVLILDNPFGPISSKHMLEPMFEIARNYNMQMICLSDLNKLDIITCFDTVIQIIIKRIALSNKEQIIHEGDEAIEHGFYRSEQQSISER